MSTKHSIIRVEVEGVEYFTLNSGESGMSISGLARCCGAPRKTLSDRLERRSDEWKLDTARVSVGGKRGNSNVVVVRDIVCAELISDFAREGKPEAIKSLIGFAAIGIRASIHQVTGWKAPDPLLALIEKHYPALPEAWRKMYGVEFFQQIERVYGYKHGMPAMGKWINCFVYDFFPAFQDRLDEVNPRKENGRRSRINTRHLSEDAKVKLEKHLDALIVLLRTARSPENFEENFRRNFKGIYQLTFFQP